MKKPTQYLASSLLSLSLFGCGTTSGLVGELPIAPAGESAANVLVLRVSSMIGVANGYTIALDGKDVFGIGSGEHAEFRLLPGEHWIGVKCFGGWTPTWKEDAVRFDAQAGKTSAFRVSPNATCARIESLDEAAVRAMEGSSKRIDLATASARK